MELPRLIEALTDPAAYPYAVAAVEVRQTHISSVFLAGPYAYKVKKPVALGFLDFTTPEKRFHFCHEEVRLNHRLAPDVYLGVVPIVASPAGVRIEGDGAIVEWAVKMRRLPDEATLLERVRSGEADTNVVETVARRIAAFHREAETNERIASFGRFDAVARNLLDIFEQAMPRVGDTVSRSVFDRTRALTEECLARLRPLIDARAARGMPRDCHGDMHLDHVYCFPQEPPPGDLVIIDCIEFNERFRFIDPVADMAFAVMDLTLNGRRDLARAFANSYFQAVGDEEGRALMPLYMAYRATVRGMVESLLRGEGEVPDSEREAARTRSLAHWLLALTELETPGRRPCLLLITGLPGSGKSTIARQLAQCSQFQVIRSDIVRKELAGVSTFEQSPPEFRDVLYSADLTDLTYAECLRRAQQLLAEGQRVLVDATFREEQQRKRFLNAAVLYGVPAAIVVCTVSPETVRRRLAERMGDASDADWGVYLQVAANWEEPGNEVRRVHHTVSAEGTAEIVLGRALEVLHRIGLQGDDTSADPWGIGNGGR